MYKFVLITLIVTFISACFFKKRMWENRYLILLIIAGVSIITNLTTNYIVQSKLNKKVITAWKKPVVQYDLNKNVIDNNYIVRDKKTEFTDCIKDSANNMIKSFHLFYYDDGKLMFAYKIGNKYKSFSLNDIYILSSNSDTVAYFAKKLQKYATKSNKWIVSYSLPTINTATYFYLPPKEYATIPDSLKRKLPF